MPPARVRAVPDDLKSEVVTAKDRAGHHGTGNVKSRKNGATAQNSNNHVKDATLGVTNAAATVNAAAGQNISGAMDWASEDSSLLHNYRALYGLDTPTAFKNPLNAALLTMPGIGRQSPTMTARKKAKRNIQKDQLAMTVRKHFNGLAISETEVVVNFLYTVKTQDRSFKMKFGVSKK